MYIPDAAARGDFFSDFDVLDMERAWSSGGEYFHSRVKTRVFELSCYYEEITIKQREAIIRWLDRRTSGELIFDDRSYATYNVRPTKKIEFDDYLQRDLITNEDLYSGTFTITFSAYYPFASLNVDNSDNIDDVRALAETGLLKSAQMPPAPGVNSSSFLMYNPGTEYAHTVIRFSGKVGSSDLMISNNTTGDKCVLKAGLYVNTGDYLEIDSKTGRVELVSGSERQLMFAFHDEGYIRLSPCMPVYREIEINTTAGSRTIKANVPTFEESMVGQYIYVEGTWKYIGQYNTDRSISVNTTSANTEAKVESVVVTMNNISVVSASDANITKFEMICKAEVR